MSADTKYYLTSQIDDQISLLINAWCELLVFSCCYRSVGSPGIIRVSNDRILTPESGREFGIEKWVEKMLNFSDQLRRLKVDYYEYVTMKVIVLLTSGNVCRFFPEMDAHLGAATYYRQTYS